MASLLSTSFAYIYSTKQLQNQRSRKPCPPSTQHDAINTGTVKPELRCIPWVASCRGCWCVHVHACGCMMQFSMLASIRSHSCNT